MHMYVQIGFKTQLEYHLHSEAFSNSFLKQKFVLLVCFKNASVLMLTVKALIGACLTFLLTNFRGQQQSFMCFCMERTQEILVHN